MSTFVYAADPRVEPISETEVHLLDGDAGHWTVKYVGEVWHAYDQNEGFAPEASWKATVEEAIEAVIGGPQLSTAHAGLVVHAAQMGGVLIGFGFSSDEQAAMDGLIAAGICEYIAEPHQVAYYRLTDTGRHVAESLGFPF